MTARPLRGVRHARPRCPAGPPFARSASAHCPSVRAAEARLQAQSLDVESVRVEFLPRLTIAGVLGVVAGSLSGLGVASRARWRRRGVESRRNLGGPGVDRDARTLERSGHFVCRGRRTDEQLSALAVDVQAGARVDVDEGQPHAFGDGIADVVAEQVHLPPDARIVTTHRSWPDIRARRAQA